MAQFDFTLSMNTTIKQRVIDGLCYTNGYTDNITQINQVTGLRETVPNPVPKPQFAKQVLVDFAKNAVKTYEANTDAEAAKSAAIVKANNEIILT